MNDLNILKNTQRLFLFSCCLFLFFSCQQFKREKLKLPDSVKKVSIIEFNGGIPYHDIVNDTIILDIDYMPILGLVEFDEQLNMKVIKAASYQREYMYGTLDASIWIKHAILNSIKKFPANMIDSTWQGNIYDGHHYFMLIENSNEQDIILQGIPKPTSPELKNLSLFLQDSVYLLLDKELKNKDSIESFLLNYEKYRPDYFEFPRLPLLPIKKEKLR